MADPASPPKFEWERNGGGAPNPLNDFRIRFYTNDFSTVVFEKELGDVEEFTPTTTEWATILAGDSLIKWVVEGRNTTAPATPDGTLARYWSGARTIGGVNFAFVIDDTGSMGEEIAGVRNALQNFINAVEAGLGAGIPAPTFALITFKDSVTTRTITNNLDALRTAVAALTATGGGDTPEFSAHALARAADIVSPGGTILLATDAPPQPGVDIPAVIAKLRANMVTLNTILSADDSFTFDSGDSSAAATLDSGTSADLTELNVSSTPALVGLSNKPGGDGDDDDGPVVPISDPGQPALDDHGSSLETATQILVNGAPTLGRVGGTDDNVDFLKADLFAGTTYTLQLATDESNVSVNVLDQDGLGVLGSAQARIRIPAKIPFTPETDGTFFFEIDSFGETTYRASITDDPLAALVTATGVLSTASAATDGVFMLIEDVNTGMSDTYENAIFNVLLSSLGPAVISANPVGLPQAETVTVTIRGNNTNWRDDNTTLSVSGTGVTVDSVSVISPTTLTAELTISAAAEIGFRNLSITTNLGGTAETADGASVVEVIAPVTEPTLLSVDPPNVTQGETTTLTLRGAMTSWDATTTVSLGIGVTVDTVTVNSPTLITAVVTVSDSAGIGFRRASVTTGTETINLDKAVFVNTPTDTVPQLASVTPNNAMAGETIDVNVSGLNTNFVEGTTTADFGAGATVNSVTVTNATAAVVNVTIDPDAAAGFRTVSLTTGTETAVLLNGFFVDTDGDPPMVDPDLFVVPGIATDEVVVDFDWTLREAGFDNEIGVFLVDDAQGRVNGLLPGDAGYAAAALARSQTVFASGEGEGAMTSLTFNGGDLLGLFLVQNATVEAWEAANPTNDPAVTPVVFFADIDANPDGVEHIERSTLAGEEEQFRWEDLLNTGDADFNDVVFTIDTFIVPPPPPPPPPVTTDGVTTVPAGATTANVSTRFDWSSREAGFDNEVGLYFVEDADGTVAGLSPSDAGYAAAALDPANSRVVFTSGLGTGATTTLNLTAGTRFGLYMIQNATTADFLAANLANDPGTLPVAFFSLTGANPDGFGHFRYSTFGDEFRIEDLLGGGDADFNDIEARFAFDLTS